MGRKTKLTPEVQQKIVTAIRAGNYFSTACEYAGIGEATGWRWMEQGEEGRSPYREFREAVKKAEADAEAKHLVNIHKASEEGNWTASAWWLERKFPDRWGRKDRQKVELTGKDDGPIEVKVDDARQALLSRLDSLASRGQAPGTDPGA